MPYCSQLYAPSFFAFAYYGKTISSEREGSSFTVSITEDLRKTDGNYPFHTCLNIAYNLLR